MAYSPHVGAQAHLSTYSASRYPSIVRKKVTVEDLLVWAYRDEMVHRALPEGITSDMVVNDWTPGPAEWRVERIDASTNLGFDASPDAYVVHRAVLALGTEPMRVPAWQPPPHAPTISRGVLPERREIVTQSRAQLVIASALRQPPDPVVEGPELEVIREGMIYETYSNGREKRDRNGAPIGKICMVRFDGDLPWIVDHQRFLYRQWADALHELRESLPDLLTAHELVGGVPALEPWKGA